MLLKNARVNQISTGLRNDIIVVGTHEYLKAQVFELNGHFQESFYKEELAKFYKNSFTFREHIRIYHHFKNRYPTLDAWFQDDLVHRVGRLSGETHKMVYTRLAYRSRLYIYHLCLFGLPLDYSYLFSIRAIDGFTHLSKHYDLDYGIQDIKQTIKNLNYEYGIFTEVRWIYNRLLMHTQKKTLQHHYHRRFNGI